jgi:hypothetical protein
MVSRRARARPEAIMKPARILLINLAAVVVGLVVYDQLRGGVSSKERAPVVRSSVADPAVLEQRIEALEAERAPMPAAVQIDARILERLEALEAAVSGSTASEAPPAAERASGETRPAQERGPASPSTASDPSAEDIRGFRELREAVRREDSIKRNRTWVDGALDKLPLRLTKKQRQRVHAAFAAFEPRVDEIWTEVKTQARETIAAGGEVDRGEIVASTTATVQQEFAKTLTDVVDHPADAEAIAAALMPGKR